MVSPSTALKAQSTLGMMFWMGMTAFPEAALLKRELGVKGTNLPDTIDAAIRALGLEGQVRSDMGLIEKAMRCWRLLFVKEEL